MCGFGYTVLRVVVYLKWTDYGGFEVFEAVWGIIGPCVVGQVDRCIGVLY